MDGRGSRDGPGTPVDGAGGPGGRPAFGRRAAAMLLLGSGIAGCTPRAGVRAQQPGAPRPAPAPGGAAAATAIVRAVPMPCADRPGDICGLVLEGRGAPAGTILVFGQAFRPGDVADGGGLAARLAADGRPLPVQLDVTRRHRDGSARFGLVSLAAPELPAGRFAGVVLARAAGGEGLGAPLDLRAALEGRRIEVEVLPQAGAPWRADLVQAAQAAAGEAPWQSGPLASQVRVVLPVPLGSVTSMRLVADVAARADGTIWVDCWFRNDIAMRPGGGDARYAARLLLDGREALAAEVPRHWQYSAWGRLVGGARGGAAAPEPPHPRHDIAYLAASAAIMPYDLSTGVQQSLFDRMARMMADPGWDTPLDPRGIQTSMGAPGARPDLGQTTLWQAAWLTTGDAGAAAFSIGQAEAAGSIPWYYWDPQGGAGGRGGWLDVRRWPGFWSDRRGGRPPTTLLQPFATDTLWGHGPVPSHQPNLSYTPYLLTGRRAFLDNLMAQAAWNVSGIWPAVRRVEGGAGPIQDVNIVQNRQTRSAAWSMRQLDEASWIATERDASLPYLEEVAAANWAWLRAQIPAWTRIQGEPHGYIPPLNQGYEANLAPWQQDYFASTAAMAALHGREDARAVLDWMRNFIVGRFFAQDRGFPRADGVSYILGHIPVPAPRPPAPPAPIHTTWAQIGETTRERGLWNDDTLRASQGEYGRLGLLSLALVHHVFADPRALEAFEWLASRNSPFVSVATFTRVPNHNVMPAGRFRVPERAPRCQPGAAPG